MRTSALASLPRIRWTAVLVVLFATGLIVGAFYASITEPGRGSYELAGQGRVPDNVQAARDIYRLEATGLIFWAAGRRETQRIVQCYIRLNLVDNGGCLSEVIFIVHGELPGDEAVFLDDLISNNTRYSKKVVETHGMDFTAHWRDLDPERFYIKLDDDIVYVAPNAIRDILKAKQQTEFLITSANVVNHAHLSWVHARLGVLYPFRPSGEAAAADRQLAKRTWELERNSSYLDGTSAFPMTYNLKQHCWMTGECAALQHYTFLQRQREGSLHEFQQFKFWDFHASGYERWSIGFIAFQGKDIAVQDFKDGEDEEAISNATPQRLQRHCGAVGSALVSHWAYHRQRRYLRAEHVDLLEGYAAIAEQQCGTLPAW